MCFNLAFWVAAYFCERLESFLNGTFSYWVVALTLGFTGRPKDDVL